MDRIIALATLFPRPAPGEAARIAIVAGCALTLILAGQALPF